MTNVRYTLVSDGSSDRVLLPVLTWLLECHCRDSAIQPQWADLRGLKKPPTTLARKLTCSTELYPCDLLFVHRDAESSNPEVRMNEIREALAASSVPCPSIFVVPIRMSEAWLLLDESAIRTAVGRPTGQTRLQLPRFDQVENLPDPKEVLFQALRDASGYAGRRLKNLRERELRYRVAELIDDFSKLRRLSAFQRLEADLVLRLRELGWVS